MSQIDALLAQIKTATYGNQVRDSIHDAIEICYDDVSTAKTVAEAATASATAAASTANTAASTANTSA